MNRFDESKNALLRYFSDLQMSQVARLIGFIVALFTLLQTAQNSNPLSKVFPIFLVSINLLSLESLKILFLFLIAFLLMLFVVRAVIRFAIFGKLSSHLISIYPFEIPENASAHDLILEKLRNRILEGYKVKQERSNILSSNMIEETKKPFRVYRKLRVTWFWPNETRLSWLLSGAIAFVLTWILLWLIW